MLKKHFNKETQAVWSHYINELRFLVRYENIGSKLTAKRCREIVLTDMQRQGHHPDIIATYKFAVDWDHISYAAHQ